MTNRPGLAARAPVLPLLCAVSLGFAQPPATAKGLVKLTATVRSVDAQAQTLEVVTGVGLALRVVSLACGEVPYARTATGRAALGELTAGDLVRIEYAQGSGGNATKTLELLPALPRGSTR